MYITDHALSYFSIPTLTNRKLHVVNKLPAYAYYVRKNKCKLMVKCHTCKYRCLICVAIDNPKQMLNIYFLFYVM